MKSDATKLASLSAVIEHDLAAIVKLDNQAGIPLPRVGTIKKCVGRTLRLL
jgi:hypothetical protein